MLPPREVVNDPVLDTTTGSPAAVVRTQFVGQVLAAGPAVDPVEVELPDPVRLNPVICFLPSRATEDTTPEVLVVVVRSRSWVFSFFVFVHTQETSVTVVDTVAKLTLPA